MLDVLVKQMNENPIKITAWSTFIASLQLMLLSFLFEFDSISKGLKWDLSFVLTVLYGAIFCTLSIFIWNHLLRRYNMNQVLPLSFLVPVFSTILSFLILDEIISIPLIISLGLILCGVYLQSANLSWLTSISFKKRAFLISCAPFGWV